jgi:hypothetical protein
VGQTAVTFDWRGFDNTIRYGLTAAYGLSAVAVTPNPLPFSSPGPFWEARLTGLQENTVYHYSIGYGPDHTFHTPLPHGSTGFTVYAEGDIGDAANFPNVGINQSAIAADLPAFTLMIGDLTYGNTEGMAAVDHHFNDVMVWSRDAAYMPAWGNHEWETPAVDDLRNYKGRFDLPNPQTSPNVPLGGGEDWYWFDYGNVRFIAYPEPFTGAMTDWQAKAQTLMDQAQADAQIRYIVTFGHRPAYSSGYHSGEPSVQSALDALGDAHNKYVLNLNGHSHDYERSYPQHGVIHLTVGTGGSSLEPVPGDCIWGGGCPPPAWSAYRAMHHVTFRLRFDAQGILGQAICGPTESDNDISCDPGTIIDSFSIGTPDQAPVVAVAPTASAIAGHPLSLNVTAADADGDAIAALSASGLPAGATFTAGAGNTAGTLSWTPTDNDVGTHPVTFTASNALSGSASTLITVFANQTFAAALTATPATGNSPLGASLDASGSIDTDGTIVSYTFSFGDGMTLGPQASPSATHYYTAGSWTASVTVIDDHGLARSTSVPIVVSPVGPGPNLVTTNPSFETDLNGWGPYGTGTITLARIPGGFDGSSALQVTGPATGLGAFGVNDSPNWVTSTPGAGVQYRFSAWVRSAGSVGTCRMQVTEYQGTTKLTTLKSDGVVLSPTWQYVTMVDTTVAGGTTLDFRIVDYPVVDGEVFLVDNVSINLLSSTLDVADAPSGMKPLQAVLSPSPLQSRSTMTFLTTRPGPLRVTLHDVHGRRVRELMNDSQGPAGIHRLPVDGKGDRGEPLASGIYFFRIQAAEGTSTGRIVIAR